MKFILGQKIEMTQRFNVDGQVIPVTAVSAGPCVVTQVKSLEKDGYAALQIGLGSKKRLTKPQAGHLKDLGKFRFLKEFLLTEPSTAKRGDVITADIFKKGDKVKVVGISKGKGFQGVVRRHHFGGSPASHGHKDQLRMPGSIGSTGPQRVLKGTRMAGHMGDSRVTVANLEIIDLDERQPILFIKGAVPGSRGGLLLIVGSGEMTLKKSATASEKPPSADKKSLSPEKPQEQAKK